MQPRIIAIDFGLKRCGLAISGPLGISLNPLDTINSEELVDGLESLCKEYDVATLVFGDSQHKDGVENKQVKQQSKIIAILKNRLDPNIVIDSIDESFTSFEAKQLIFQSGIKKKERRNKSLVDKVSAVLILQRYIESKL